MSAYDRLLTRHAQDDDDELFVEAIFGDPDLLDALVERGKLVESWPCGAPSAYEGHERHGICRPTYAPTSGATDQGRSE